ncbi:MAG: tetratricopeptide repeat protein [Alphaproteobacteria bacterium]|nr:tetratricopeptide repeat protein [Alphaproteobacteria bacterium]
MDPARKAGRVRLAFALAAALLLVAPTFTRAGEDSGEASPEAPAPDAKDGKASKAGRQGRRGQPPELRKQGPSTRLAHIGEASVGRRGGPGDGASVAFRKDQFRRASGKLRALLDVHPDNLRAHCMLAMTEARAGFYADAIAGFGLCAGDPLYEVEGISDHADTLRALGHPAEAAALRLSQRVNVEGEDTELPVLLDAALDLRFAGDDVGAEELLVEATGLFPRSSSAHAELAELLFAQGRLDDAEFHLWLADLYGGGLSHRTRLVLGRVQLAEDNLVGANETLTRASNQRPRSADAAALLAESLRRMGRADEALDLLQGNRFTFHEHPALLAAEARALADVGRTAEATAILSRALAIYPHYPDVLDARAHLTTLCPSCLK